MSNTTDHPQSAPSVPAVEREVVVRAPIDTCFRVFVDGFGTWWPPEHHIGEDRTMTAFVVEPFVGGRCYDVDTTGFECQWGTVLAYEPSTSLVLAWHIQGDWTIDLDPALQSEINVSFEPLDAATTRVRVVHDHLERHAHAPGVHQGISGNAGWRGILVRFTDVVEGRDPSPLAL